MTAIVVGGSSGLGRALCEELAARGRNLVIVASGAADVRRLAEHLRLLHGVAVRPLAIDARDPAAFADALVRGLDGIAPVTDLFLPMGLAFDDDQVGEAGRRLEEIWQVNYVSIVLAIERILPLMTPGRIVGFGSIAAARARNRNLQYAAAKAALSSYFEGLRHRLLATNLVAQYYVVGYIESGQSFGKNQLFPPLPARRAARLVLSHGNRNFGRRFLPAYWAPIAAVLRLLPWRIFSRLGV